LPDSTREPLWVVYVFGIYVLAERLYVFFRTRDVNIAYAFPFMFAIYVLNLVGLLVGGQERLPLLNRAEHLVSFVLIAYIVWIFFTQYLPQAVWKEHPYYTALLVMAVTSALGVGNEIVELALDSIAGTSMIGGRFDTPLDLLMNTLGAALFLSVRLIVGVEYPAARSGR
jgi:hypothetical protein